MKKKNIKKPNKFQYKNLLRKPMKIIQILMKYSMIIEIV
jgi:hypothetical protein